jgi:hypothetical protein
MLRIFPALLFYGVAVTIVQRVKAARTVDKLSARFVVAAAVTALVLFLLPAVSLGSVLQPWKDFYAKTSLHDSGVYVNHLGLRAMVLFEPSHLSLEKFVEAYRSSYTDDIVRHWQDVKERELGDKRPLIFLASLFVVACLTAIVWKRKDSESVSVLWPLLLIYTTSYLSAYYYAFLCLFVLLFFRRTDPLRAFLPLGLLLTLNIVALVTDSFKPSPIVFFTSINVYLFLCLFSILVFESYATFFRPAASVEAPQQPPREVRRRGRRARSHGK